MTFVGGTFCLERVLSIERCQVDVLLAGLKPSPFCSFLSQSATLLECNIYELIVTISPNQIFQLYNAVSAMNLSFIRNLLCTYAPLRYNQYMGRNVVLAFAMFPIATNGLLFSPTLKRMRWQNNLFASQHQPFDWRPGDETTTGEASPSAPQQNDDVTVNVDVDRTPMFVVFTAGDERYHSWQREDIIGGTNADACRARLLAAITLVSKRAGARKGGNDDGLENTECDAGVEVDGSPRGNVSSRMFTSSASEAADVDNTIVDIPSRAELRQIVSSLRQGHGPVVVMYHAPWCRKCAYLTPIFRGLARRRTFNRADGTTVVPTFYRVDVSKWGIPYTNKLTSPALRIEHSKDRKHGSASRLTLKSVKEDEVGLLHEGSKSMENCETCGNSGFVPCGTCESKGVVIRSSPDGKHTLVITCPTCVGYKRLRCPSCGGKCYMCD